VHRGAGTIPESSGLLNSDNDLREGGKVMGIGDCRAFDSRWRCVSAAKEAIDGGMDPFMDVRDRSLGTEMVR
jgi:hypothetical protein